MTTVSGMIQLCDIRLAKVEMHVNTHLEHNSLGDCNMPWKRCTVDLDLTDHELSFQHQTAMFIVSVIQMTPVVSRS